MKTLAQLEKEAQNQPDWESNPKEFIAKFPSGFRNGRFLDPFMGIIQLNDMDGFITMSDLNTKECNPFNIPAMWL